MKFEKVLNGVQKYIQREFCPKLNDWQELAINVVIGRAMKKTDTIKNFFTNNGLVKALGFVDENGDVNINELYHEIKSEVQKKNHISIDIPLVGNIKLGTDDVDKMYRIITAGEEA